MNKKPLEPNIIELMRHMKIAGCSNRRIRRVLGYSLSTISKYCHDLEART